MSKQEVKNIKSILQKMSSVLMDLAYTAESDFTKSNIIYSINKIDEDISQLEGK